MCVRFVESAHTSSLTAQPANQMGTQIYPVCVNNAWRVQIFYEGGLCLRDVTGFLYADDVT